MFCPVCQKPMIIVEYRKIELDHCPKCGGVWFDSNELELFLKTVASSAGGFTAGAVLKQPEVKADHPRRCPLCRRTMRQVEIGSPPVLVDVCPQEEGLWFDGGEVHELVSQFVPQAVSLSGSEMMAFIKDMFRARK
ncbi:MAG: zf-TFIIB domain-containing protein [Dehalococcoidales bacterium]|nr:zf-TFIIB domain-containing protein [Dehalococcoidales bacterium]